MNQTKFFIKYPLAVAHNNELLQESAEIVNKAIIDTDPYAIGLMLSGGDDSITALEVALSLGVKIDFIMHGVTGTGLKDVRKYVHEVAARTGIKLIEANAGSAYENYVKRKGFFGRGKDAHKFSYHILKTNPFESCLSKNIIQRKKNRRIILLNGVRVEESENRMDNFGDNPYRWRKNQQWVNIIHWWTKRECLSFLEEKKIQRSPVSIALGRSGECNCGTMQSDAERICAEKYDPEWGEWMNALRKYVVGKFGWDINRNPNKKMLDEIKDKAAKLTSDMPMCVGCKGSAAMKLFADL